MYVLMCSNLIMMKKWNIELPYACYTRFLLSHLFISHFTWFEKKRKGKERKEYVGLCCFLWLLSSVYTSCPLPLVSLLTRFIIFFLPNLLTELALNMSCSVVLLIGIVPSGHDSPDKLHNWKFSLESPFWLCPLGLSGGSCTHTQTCIKIFIF